MNASQKSEYERLKTEKRMAEGHLEQARQRLKVTQEQYRSGAEMDVQRYEDQISRADEKMHRLMEK